MPAKSPAEIHVLFQDAFNLGDVEALASLYELHAVLMVAGQAVKGRESIGAAFRSMVSAGATMSIETRSIIESPDGLAVLHGEWTVERKAGAASGATTQGVSTELVRKQPDGTWLFVIDDPNALVIGNPAAD